MADNRRLGECCLKQVIWWASHYGRCIDVDRFKLGVPSLGGWKAPWQADVLS
ncbi:MAG: hypothetical protein M3Q83_01015 [Pseudomonadota bacterium]|nr:hypothetical protein [Pseudomonadota bacterium]